MNAAEFLLGVDGGGTQCRARLADFLGATLGAERLALVGGLAGALRLAQEEAAAVAAEG